MEQFSVNRLAKMANISVRTLHHYDEIGLLKPAFRAGSGYRYYTRAELLRLQQILFYREMDISLSAIQQILDDPEFDTLKALAYHKSQLYKQKEKLDCLLRTIDNTILDLKNNRKMLRYEEMYEGLSKEQAAGYEKEVAEKWGEDKLQETKENIQAMSKGQWDDLKAEGEEIYNALARLMDWSATAPEVQRLIIRHHAMTNKFYDCPLDTYRGLGDLYVNDERFTATFDKYRPGLASFMREAIGQYCDARRQQ